MTRTFRVPGRLLTRLTEEGVPVARVLRRAGLTPDFFEQTRILVSTAELFALWFAIADVSQNPTIGLKLGTENNLARFHPSGLAALASNNFGAAIDQMARYKRLSAPEEILHEQNDSEWAIQFRWLLGIGAEPAVLVEYCFAWTLTIARAGTGLKIRPLRVELLQPRAHLEALETHFECPVVCGGSRNAIIFKPSDASLPFVTRNAELLEMLAPQFEQELKDRTGGENGFVELVRGAIQQRLTGHRPLIEDIARACA